MSETLAADASKAYKDGYKSGYRKGYYVGREEGFNQCEEMLHEMVERMRNGRGIARAELVADYLEEAWEEIKAEEEGE